LREASSSDPLIFQLIEKKDPLNPYNGPSLEEIQKAKEIAITFIKNMLPPRIAKAL
jgi:hypothetical protein